VDGGSYDGDSVRSFIKKVKNKYEKILAFEPDKIIYKKLVRKMNLKRKIECLNQGLFNKSGKVNFSTTSNRASLIDSGGTSSINVASIDSILNGNRVSFIKMNIEGAEINALKGAKKSIKQWLPKMAISCYHRPSDLWQIPLLIRKMSKKYNLYLRQHDGGVIESVCYATYQNY
jgi:FkbM family methyltransferase